MPQVTANGVSLEVERYGDPANPPLLLIMGLGAQLTLWPIELVEALVARGYHVIRYDNRDIGLSTKFTEHGVPNVRKVVLMRLFGLRPRLPYRLTDMAADAVGLLDALGIAKAHIVGASMGGMIAQIVAAKHGARARSLVSIMSSTNRPGLPQAAPEITGALITPPASPGREDRIAHFKTLFRTIGSPGFPATEDEIQTLAEGVVDRAPYDPAGIGRQLVAILSSEPRHEMLKAVRCPALVLHGADDPLIPIAGGEDTAASIPGAEFVAVPGMGHDFTEALMPEFIRHAGGFLTRAEQRGKAA